MKIITSLIAISLIINPLMTTWISAGGTEIPTDLSQKEKPATIKVLIAQKKSEIFLEAKGNYSIYNPQNEHLLSSGISTKRHLLTSTDQGLKWKDLFPGIYQIRLVPNDSKGSLLVDGIEYRGVIEIWDFKGKLYVVNEVDIERYLKSILTSQFPNAIDEEVMDAIAIVARTNAYYLASRKLDAPWHVDASEVNYQGYAVTLQNLHVDQAVNNTRYMVLTYHGKPFATTWSKDSAGKTADYSTIFRKDVESPKGVETPFAAHDREKHAWNFSISRQELAKALGAARINAFDLYQDKKSQKVYGARVKDGTALRQFDFSKLQKALGAARLKSNDFNILVQGDQIIFKGFGEGVGVGLCLLSAQAMADKGDKAPKILSAFYPETQLEKMRSFGEKEQREHGYISYESRN